MQRDYAQLIEDFLSRAIPVEEFERRYLEWFKSEPSGMNPRAFEVLDRLFADVDAYYPETPAPPETIGLISEQQLRERAALALKALQAIDH